MADYKTEIAETLEETWTTGAGNAARVTVTLEREMTDYYGDGNWTFAPRSEWAIVTRSWKDGSGSGPVEMRHQDHLVAVACIGDLGLTAERRDRIRAMYAEIDQHELRIAQRAARKSQAQIDAEYFAGQARVDSMMTANGRSC